MQELANNINTIKKIWDLSGERFAALFGDVANANKVYSYLKGTAPSIDFLLKLEELSGFSFRELCMENIKRLDVPDHPYKNKFGVVIINDKEQNILNEDVPIYGKSEIDYLRELVEAQKETIALQRERIKFLEGKK